MNVLQLIVRERPVLNNLTLNLDGLADQPVRLRRDVLACRHPNFAVGSMDLEQPDLFVVAPTIDVLKRHLTDAGFLQQPCLLSLAALVLTRLSMKRTRGVYAS